MAPTPSPEPYHEALLGRTEIGAIDLNRLHVANVRFRGVPSIAVVAQKCAKQALRPNTRSAAIGYSLPPAAALRQVRFGSSFGPQRAGGPLCARFWTCVKASGDGAKLPLAVFLTGRPSIGGLLPEA